MTVPQPKILCVNPFGIGDVLFTTPLIRAVREAFPNSYIGYLCNRRTEGILRHNVHLNELLVYEKDDLQSLWRQSPWQGASALLGTLRRIRSRQFNWVIDLSLGERYSLIMRLLGIPTVVGFNYRKRGRFLTESLPIDGYHDAHVVEYYRRLLSFIGIRMQNGMSELAIAPEDSAWAERWLKDHGIDAGTPLIGIVPAGGVSWGSHASYRRWGVSGFAAVGDALADRFRASILLFGEKSDSGICSEVAHAMRHPVVDVSGQTTLGRFVSLIARLSLVICNDGGPLHLAVSQGVKTVSLFGPVDPVVYGPYPLDPKRHRVVLRSEVRCRPCYHNFRLPPCPYERACLTHIEPQDVIQACTELLEQGANAAPPLAHAG